MSGNDHDDASLVDPVRSVHLYDVGGPGYLAATAIQPDGDTHYVIARLNRLGEEEPYRPTCPEVEHEQTGALPLEFVKRIAVAQRRRR